MSEIRCDNCGRFCKKENIIGCGADDGAGGWAEWNECISCNSDRDLYVEVK